MLPCCGKYQIVWFFKRKHYVFAWTASVVSPASISFTQALLAAARHPNQETFRRCVDAIAAVPEAPRTGKPFGAFRGQTFI